jgi:hypothetical protein
METQEGPQVLEASEAPQVQVETPPKRVILSIPGDNFTSNFILSWTQTLYTLWKSGKYEVLVSPGTSSFVSFARMKTLGLSVLRGKDQKPFDDKIDYFAWITIDSDVVYRPESLLEMLAALEIEPVVAGYYSMSDAKSFAVVKDWDTEYFKNNGTFKFLGKQDIQDWQEQTKKLFMPVSYSGLGFFGVRKEVLDALKYPYFDSALQYMDGPDDKQLVDLCSEDVAFCKNIQAAGYTINLHTGLRVGHEKRVVL